MLTQERLREVLKYDPVVGEFRWRIDIGTGRIGVVAGCLDGKGYLVIKIDRKKYYGSQLAFLYMTGKFAIPTADHKDRNPSNTQWTNLREATRRQNIINSKPTGRSGLKGASWSEAGQKWKSSVKTNGRRIHLGYFETAEEAHHAYMDAARRFYGEFVYSAN